MILYQAHYSYGPEADDRNYYYGDDGELYSNKEACEKEIDFRLHPEKYISGEYYETDLPIIGEVREIKIKDTFTLDL